MENKKVLLRVRDLKQYFPLKSNKRLAVKANDGITVDIYEGETFGLVGESGCGKSTFGRVLLQLYHQTHGRTMYYGRTRESLAPRYVVRTIKNLPKLNAAMLSHRAKADAHALELEKLKSQTSEEDKAAQHKLFLAMEEQKKLSKRADDAFLDLVTIAGGFLSLGDYTQAQDVYTRLFLAAGKRRRLSDGLGRAAVRKERLAYQVAHGKEGKKPALGRVSAVVDERQAELDRADADISAIKAELDRMRAGHAGDARFAEYEAQRDDGIDLARLSYSEMRRLRSDLQLIFQDPYSSLNPRMTVAQIIGESLLAHNFFEKNGAQMQEYIVKVMEDCGLAAYMFHRYPHQFSGGQRQRIGIARSLAVHPRFIVCDEAVSALDVSIQSQIINLLKDLKDKANLTYLFISHDLSVVKYISDRIAVMYLGNIVELATSEETFRNPLHPYTEALLAAIPTTDVRTKGRTVLLEGDIPSPVNPPKGCKFHTRCRYATDICKVVTPELVEVSQGHFVACHHRDGSYQGAMEA